MGNTRTTNIHCTRIGSSPEPHGSSATRRTACEMQHILSAKSGKLEPVLGGVEEAEVLGRIG